VVDPDTVRAVLAALGVHADEPAPHRRLPPTVVRRAGAPADLPDAGLVILEDGTRIELGDAQPPDLPFGYHRLEAGDETAHLIQVPGRCPLPTRQRQWGWMVQLYAARSQASWGTGDLADLAWLARWGAAQGAGFVLVNPLHAPSPVLPLEPSPYYPSSRRYTNPLYLRIEDLPELAAADGAVRARVAALAAERRADNRRDRLDRDAAWRAKLEVLSALHGTPPDPRRQAAFDAYRRAEGEGLTDFATFCALAERHGVPYQEWPAELRHPRSEAVGAARAQLAGRVQLHAWIQWLCAEQLAGTQEAARAAGMDIGIVHDLAVGVDPGGADAWALQDDLAGAVTVGAPPDSFNQQGQDWQVPPLRPDRLAATGYAAVRDIVGSTLRHGGGIRIDHILGLFRLWWIPEGASPAQGTYVRYPADDLLGVLALEAHRAGALVIGEDLGTVERGVRDTLADRGLLGSRVVYFEREDGDRYRPAADYPELVLASVNTHDLPPVAAWLADGGIGLQAELGLLAPDTTTTAELERAAAARAALVDLLRAEGLVGAVPDEGDLVAALHAFLARTPSLLVAASLADAVGDRRQANVPGTTDAYPNWRLPVSQPAAEGDRPVLLEDLETHPGVRRLVAALRRTQRPA
jgi:4-alpha-glucanotransferase